MSGVKARTDERESATASFIFSGVQRTRCMAIIHRLVHATVVLRPTPCTSILAAAMLQLSFALKKDGRSTARIVPSICNAADACYVVPTLMKLAGHSRCFLRSFSISVASVACLAYRCCLPMSRAPDVSAEPATMPLSRVASR